MRLRLAALAVAIVGALTLLVSSATAGPPPSYLCNRSTLGVVASGGDGHLYRCSVKIKFVGPYAYTTYYWLDIGFPV